MALIGGLQVGGSYKFSDLLTSEGDLISMIDDSWIISDTWSWMSSLWFWFIVML